MAAVVAVGDDAADQREEQDGQLAEEGVEPEVEGRGRRRSRSAPASSARPSASRCRWWRRRRRSRARGSRGRSGRRRCGRRWRRSRRGWSVGQEAGGIVTGGLAKRARDSPTVRPLDRLARSWHSLYFGEHKAKIWRHPAARRPRIRPPRPQARPHADHRAAAARTDGPGGGCATDVAALDACLRGGLPRGQLSEMAGPRSSGRTTLLLQMMAAATQRGEIVALRRHLRSARRAVGGRRRRDLRTCSGSAARRSRRWTAPPIRAGCPASARWTGGPSELVERTVDRALKALNLVLQAGGFGVVAIDLADVPLAALTRHPVHHLAARAADDRRQRHGLRAARARAAGAQRRRPHALAERPLDLELATPIAAAA